MQRDPSLSLIVGFLGTLTVIAVAFVLMAAKSVILPFVFALFAAVTLEPIVTLLRRIRIPRYVSAILIVGVLYLVLQLVVGLVVGAVNNLDAQLPDYLQALEGFLHDLPLPENAELKVTDPAYWRDLVLSAFGENVGSIAGAVTNLLSNAGLVLILTVAIIIGRRGFDERLDLVAAEATGRPTRTADVIDSIDAGIQRYMAVKFGVSVVMGVCGFLLLWAIGFEFAVLAGFLLFLLNFVPTFGPLIAAVPTIGLLILQFRNEPDVAVLGGVLLAAMLIVFANFIEPKLFGRQLNLNFFAVILALLLWVFIWGPAGAVVAVPVTLAVSLVAKEVPALRPLHDLLRA